MPIALSEKPHLPLAAASLSVSLTGICSILIGSMLPSIVSDLRLDGAQTGLLTGSPGFGYLAGVLLAGFLGDRLGYQIFWRLGTVAGTLALIGIALAPSFGVTLVAAAMLGLVPGFFDGSINPLLVCFSGHKSAGVLNRVHSFFGVGVTIGSLVVGAALAAGILWRWQFAAAAVLALAVLLAVFSLRLTRTQRPIPSLLSVLHTKSLWQAMTASAMYGGLEIIMLSWVVLYLVRLRAVPQATASMAISLFGVMLIIGRAAASKLVGRIGASRLVVSGSILAAVGLTLLVVLPGQFLPWLGVGLTGLGMSGVLLTVTAEASRRAPGLEGSVTALVSAASGIGKWLLPLAIGQLAQAGHLAYGILLGMGCALIMALVYARPALRNQQD
ncbi:MAG: MFS transporter [Chloroflexi bacterium]|nr:MFS transporter [Chloroflexota bacterium]